MKFIVVPKSGDISALTLKVAPDRLKQLNPHADLAQLTAGTVLLLPDDAKAGSGNAAAGERVGDDAFTTLGADIANGLASAGQRIRKAADLIAADRSGVTTTLRAAGVKRLVDSDAVLKKQLAEADTRAKAEATQAQDDAKAVDALQKLAADALAQLAARLG